jgi:hypothetical protein
MGGRGEPRQTGAGRTASHHRRVGQSRFRSEKAIERSEPKGDSASRSPARGQPSIASVSAVYLRLIAQAPS